jgi:hypothetical protein
VRPASAAAEPLLHRRLPGQLDQRGDERLRTDSQNTINLFGTCRVRPAAVERDERAKDIVREPDPPLARMTHATLALADEMICFDLDLGLTSVVGLMVLGHPFLAEGMELRSTALVK